MSENTKIGEVLIVCRRWSSEMPKPPTRVINLAENPATDYEALALVQRLGRGESGPFTVQNVPADRIARGDWNAVNFYSGFLVEAFRDWSEGRSASAVRPLSEIAYVGPAGQRIRDAYTRSDQPTTSGRRALWHHKTDMTQSMHARTDSYIEPKQSKVRLADKYWEQRSSLLLPHRLRLNLARVCAAQLDQSTVGSLWTPCRPLEVNEDVERALAAFCNSTVGILSLLGARDNRVPSYPQFSLDTLRGLIVPDFRSADIDTDLLSAAYGAVQDEVLQPFPMVDEDSVRQQLDDVVTKALQIDPDWVATVRQSLAEEPSVTGRRFGT